MKQAFLLVVFVAAGLWASAQLVPLDSIGQYSDKNITIFGTVNATQYSDSTEQDTMYLKLAGTLTNQLITLIIYPECRVKFGYRPDLVLLNKKVYVSGVLKAKNGNYSMEIQSPFDIAFSQPRFQTGKTNTDFSERYERKKSKPVTNEIKPQLAKVTSSNLAQNTSSTTGDQIYKVVDSFLQFEKQVANRAAIRDKEQANIPPSKIKAESKPEKDRHDEKIKVVAATQTQPPALPQQKITPNESVSKETLIEKPFIHGEAMLKANASIKSGPGRYFAVYGYLKKGDKVNVLLRHTEWSKIATKEGQSGKVIEGFVKSDELQ
jgi:hypothetical protein